MPNLICGKTAVGGNYNSTRYNKDAQVHLRKTFGKKDGRKEEIVQMFNQKLSELNDEERCYMFCTDIIKRNIFVVAAYPALAGKCVSSKKIAETVLAEVLQNRVEISLEEITADKFLKKIESAERYDYLTESKYQISDTLHVDYFENSQYDIKQEIIRETELNYTEAENMADVLMSSSSMKEEIGRIYCPENPKKFLGHPVHYRIRCSRPEAGYKMAELIVKSLLANGRLLGSRMDKITRIKEGCYDESDLAHLMENASGNTVLIDTKGEYDFASNNFACVYENVVWFYNSLIQKHNNDVLFIFMEDVEHPGFSKELAAKVMEYIDIIDIEEGKGDRKSAERYLAALVSESEMAGYADDAKENIRYDKEEYTASELHSVFNWWRMECLRHSVYKSYADRKQKEIVDKAGKSSRELADLIGLESVKNMVGQIIAANVVDKRRREATSKEFGMSKHMVFTGNPGSAKTTVARIIADTLKEEGVLKKGTFVECGRADLVDRFVGWTAKTVREQFRKASGGILFIDEAYSLVDGSNSFGDEAINTIVQEMENHRDDVIVIFAGYPDKMQLFLESNEGLKSRISFYVNFPDYQLDDLMKIFEKMLKEKEYRATKGAKEKIKEILKAGCGQPNFGNGRFVRNVLEQAILKQSVRLYEKYKGKEIPRKELLLLKEADAELEYAVQTPHKKQGIGFCA